MTGPANGVDVPQLTDREKKALAGPPLSNEFEPSDIRLFSSWDGGTVFDYGHGDAHDMRNLLVCDGTSRSLEQTITLPERGADWEIRAIDGDRGEAEWVRDQLGDRMTQLIAHMSSASIYRKAFFECSWDLDAGRVVLADVGFRPATACEAAYDARTGTADGFRKRTSLLAGNLVGRESEREDPRNPGYVRIPAARAFIHTAGTHREPIIGLSDLDIALWAWKTQQKILFLYCQYLEQQSLPKTAAYGMDEREAVENGQRIADAKASGVVPMVRSGGDPSARMFDIIESSGRGGDQFLECIRWLDSRKTQSVLASFTELATAASAEGRGSNALSMDQSEFFLASRQASADEKATAVTNDLIRRMVRWNFGSDAAVPWLKIGPLSRRNTDRALDMLGNLITATNINAPDSFVDQLLTSTAAYLGLDARKLERAIVEKRRADELAQRQAQQAEQAAAAADPGKAVDAELDGAVSLANELVLRSQGGEDPHDVLGDLAGRPRPTPVQVPPSLQLAGAEQERKTGGMVALVPDAASAARLAVDHPDAEQVADLHVTLLFLGEDITGWDADLRADLIAAVRDTAKSTVDGPIKARAWSHATFNPDGGPDGTAKPCAVYLIGGPPDLTAVHDAVEAAARTVLGDDLRDQHTPWVPHATAGYGLTAADLHYTGAVTFDRVLVALAGEHHEIPLAGDGLSLAAVNGQHVPGTAYHWRHGWEPLDVQTALLHGKRKAADKLHKSGSSHFNAEPASWWAKNPGQKKTLPFAGGASLSLKLPGGKTAKAIPLPSVTKAKKSGKHVIPAAAGSFQVGDEFNAEVPGGGTRTVKITGSGKEFPTKDGTKQYFYTAAVGPLQGRDGSGSAGSSSNSGGGASAGKADAPSQVTPTAAETPPAAPAAKKKPAPKKTAPPAPPPPPPGPDSPPAGSAPGDAAPTVAAPNWQGGTYTPVADMVAAKNSDTTPEALEPEKPKPVAPDSISQALVDSAFTAGPVSVTSGGMYLSEVAASAQQKAVQTGKPHFVVWAQGAGGQVFDTAPQSGPYWRLDPDGTEWEIKASGMVMQVPPAMVHQHLAPQYAKATSGGGSSSPADEFFAAYEELAKEGGSAGFGNLSSTAADYAEKVTTTAGERSAMNSYTGAAYADLNKYLRTGDLELKLPGHDKMITNLDSMIGKYQLPKAVKVRRGIASTYFPKAAFKPGDVIVDDGYVSTSFASGFGGDVRFNIVVPAGMNAISVNGAGGGSHPHEQELILPRGTRFVVDSDTTIGGTRWLNVIALPPETQTVAATT